MCLWWVNCSSQGLSKILYQDPPLEYEMIQSPNFINFWIIFLWIVSNIVSACPCSISRKILTTTILLITLSMVFTPKVVDLTMYWCHGGMMTTCTRYIFAKTIPTSTHTHKSCNGKPIYVSCLQVAKENKSTLPSAGLFIIRYHSFYGTLWNQLALQFAFKLVFNLYGSKLLCSFTQGRSI